MEVIIYFLLIAAAIWLIVHVIVPIGVVVGSIGALIIGGIAFIYGSYSALVNYISAIHQEMNFKSWKWERGDEPARRSYFFGPGYAQLWATIKKAFSLNAVTGSEVNETAETIKGSNDNVAIIIVRTLGSWLFIIVAYICIYGVGSVLCAVLGLIHGTITTAIMAIIYIIFTVVWIIDRIYLLKNKIRSDCPSCHSRFLIPMFMCPQCGAMHRKLVPGAFWVL